METQNSIQKELKIIYNNDVEVLNFLADLQDREPLHALQRFINFSDHAPIALLHCCPSDGLVVMILYKPPFACKGNILALYAHPELIVMARYFREWYNSLETAHKKGDMINALKEIVRLLYDQWTELNDKNALADFRG